MTAGASLAPRQAAAQPGNRLNGKKLFLTYCFICHGKTGRGDGLAAELLDPKPRDFTDDAYMSGLSDQQLFDSVSGGGAGFGGSAHMSTWEDSFSIQERWDLVAYLRQFHRP